MKPKFNMMVDCGAWPAFTRGVPIDIKQYAKYLDRVGAVIDCAISLDVIPKDSSPAGCEEAAAASWKNYRWLTKRGYKVMPTYHRGERRYWLDKILDSGTDYLGLGGIASNPGARAAWLKSTFDSVCCDDGWPKVRVHGFGVGGVPEMTTYPWYSVDFTSYYLVAFSGILWVPRFVATTGQYGFDRSPTSVVVGNSAGRTSSNHVIHLGGNNRKYIRQYLESIGMQLEQVTNDETNSERMRANIRFLQRLIEVHKPMPYRSTRADLSLFGKPSVGTSGMVVDKLRIFMGLPFHVRAKKPDAVGLDLLRSDILREEQVRDRLGCYYYETDIEALSWYITRDRLPRYKDLGR